MALINCQECGGMVSSEASNCPHCGNPLKMGGYNKPQQEMNKSSKKIAIILFLVIMILLCIIIGGAVYYAFIWEGTFQYKLTKDTVELGTETKIESIISYDTAKIKEVTVKDANGFNTDKLGKYSITYTLVNDRGNAKDITIETEVVDTVSPILALTEDEIWVINGNVKSIDGYIQYEDASGSCDIVYDGEYDLNKDGDYTFDIYVKDSSGNESDKTSMTVHVITRKNCIYDNVCLGDSKEDVLKFCSLKYNEEATKEVTKDGKLDLLIYDENISGVDCNILFYFNNDILSEFRLYPVDPSAYANDYFDCLVVIDNMKKIISEFYGQPSTDTTYKSSLYPYCATDEQALQIGELKYYTEWTRNGQIAAGIMYDSDELAVIMDLSSLEK